MLVYDGTKSTFLYSVEQDIISQTVVGDRIIDVIIFICIPIIISFMVWIYII